MQFHAIKYKPRSIKDDVSRTNDVTLSREHATPKKEDRVLWDKIKKREIVRERKKRVEDGKVNRHNGFCGSTQRGIAEPAAAERGHDPTRPPDFQFVQILSPGKKNPPNLRKCVVFNLKRPPFTPTEGVTRRLALDFPQRLSLSATTSI